MIGWVLWSHKWGPLIGLKDEWNFILLGRLFQKSEKEEICMIAESVAVDESSVDLKKAGASYYKKFD